MLMQETLSSAPLFSLISAFVLPLIENFISNLVTSKITIQDLFHVYLNKCEFHFLRLHVNKKNNFCFLLYNGRVRGMTK